MNDTAVLHIATETAFTAAKLAAPILLAALAVGFGISLFQSVTQIQEVTLSFVPKAVAVVTVVLVSGHWMLNTIIQFTNDLFAQLPTLLNSS